MNFHEQSIDSSRDAGSRQMRNVLRLAAGFVALPAGQLQTVCDIENHRTSEILHDGKRTEVHHQIVVAERSAALGKDQDSYCPLRAL